jgi:hypothetical protein
MSSIVGRWASAQLGLMEELQHDLGVRDHEPARWPSGRPARRPAPWTWLLRVLTGRGAAAAR